MTMTVPTTLKWWLIRLPLYNLAILLLIAIDVTEAYFYPPIRPPEATVGRVSLDFVEVMIMLNIAYCTGPLLDVAIAKTSYINTARRWLIFGVGTILSLIVAGGAAGVILTPF
jgi:hypothetical protein